MFKNEPLIFRTLPTGCFIIVNKKVNHDGYYRKLWVVNKKRIIEMFHRFIWRINKGKIPKGYEINHLCNNRGCCNIKHLECLPKKQHIVVTNQNRYKAPSGRFFK